MNKNAAVIISAGKSGGRGGQHILTAEPRCTNRTGLTNRRRVSCWGLKWSVKVERVKSPLSPPQPPPPASGLLLQSGHFHLWTPPGAPRDAVATRKRRLFPLSQRVSALAVAQLSSAVAHVRHVRRYSWRWLRNVGGSWTMNKSLGHCLVLHCCETTSLALFHCHHTGQTLVSHMRASVVLLLLPLLPMTVKPLTHFCIELQ